jgi:hypothetical protein
MAQLTEAYLKSLIKKVIKEEYGEYSHTEEMTQPFTTQHNVALPIRTLEGILRSYKTGVYSDSDRKMMISDLELLLTQLRRLSSPAHEQTPTSLQYRKQTRGY